MKRSVISLIIIGFHILILTVALRLPVAADSLQQTVPAADATPTAAFTPFQISVRQQVPLALTIRNTIATTETLTSTATLTESIAVTLNLQFDFTFTNTLTTTVPSTVTITFGDQQTMTVPVSLTVALTPTAAIVITPLAPITVASPLTLTGALSETTVFTQGLVFTPTLGLTTTVPPQILNPTVVSSVAITANLRSGPDTTFDVQTSLGAGQSILVVAQNADGTWYLLNNGLWVAAFLVGNPPASLPIATEDLVTTLREQNPLTPTVPIIATPIVTTTVAVTSTTPLTTSVVVTEESAADPGLPILVATATPVAPAIESTPSVTQPVTATIPTTATISITATATPAAPVAAESPSTTVDANLREGPGTTFAVIGGTVTGQTLTIVARNADGSWFQLDNGGWLAAFLVANAPDPATVPLFDGNAAPQPESTLPTATLTPTVALTPTFGVQENLYVIRVDGITDRYNFALSQIESLVTRAQNAPALLENQEWIIQMTTMITLLRSAGDELQALAAPAIFSDVQGQLVQAATAYSTAAALLAEAIDQLQADRLTDANAQIAIGNQLLGAAQSEVDRLTP